MTDDQWSTDKRETEATMREALKKIVALCAKKASCNQRGRDELVKAIALKALWQTERKR